MKRLLLFLAFASPLFGQYTIPAATSATAQFTCPWSDSFSGSGALAAQWVNVPSMATNSATLVQASGVAQVSAVSSRAVAIAPT